MDKIRIILSRKEWIALTGIVLAESSNVKSLDDRYWKALLESLLFQVYVKLHNKMHSLRESKNALSLSVSEAAAFNYHFADEFYEPGNVFASAVITAITGQIDKKLA